MNESIALRLDGYLPLDGNPFAAYFHPATYNFSLVSRRRGTGATADALEQRVLLSSRIAMAQEASAAAFGDSSGDMTLKMGLIDMEAMESYGLRDSRLHLRSDSLAHSVNMGALKQGVALFSEYLHYLMGGGDQSKSGQVDGNDDVDDNDGGNVIDSTPSTVDFDHTAFSLAVDGETVTRLFGIDFPRIPLHYEILLRWSLREYVERMHVKLADCKIPNGDREYECEVPSLARMLSRNVGSGARRKREENVVVAVDAIDGDDDDDDDDPTQDLQIRLTASLLNPTTFDLNFGRIDVTVRYLSPTTNRFTPFAAVSVPDFHLHYTRDLAHEAVVTDQRQNLTAVVTPLDVGVALELLGHWKAGENVTIGVSGKDIVFAGYGGQGAADGNGSGKKEGSATRLTWFEALLGDLDLRLQLPAMPGNRTADSE